MASANCLHGIQQLLRQPKSPVGPHDRNRPLHPPSQEGIYFAADLAEIKQILGEA